MVDIKQGCQIGLFDAKCHKFGLYFRSSCQLLWRQKSCLASWLFLFNILAFLRQLLVGTYYQTGLTLNMLVKNVARLHYIVHYRPTLLYCRTKVKFNTCTVVSKLKFFNFIDGRRQVRAIRVTCPATVIVRCILYVVKT